MIFKRYVRDRHESGPFGFNGGFELQVNLQKVRCHSK